MDENRRYKRLNSEDADLKCNVQFTNEVKLLNISSSGASISLNKQLNMGQEYRLHIRREKDYIAIRGTVVWERLIASTKNEIGEIVPIYKAGIKFDNVLTDKGAELISFLEKNLSAKGFKARLRGMRIEIGGNGRDTLTEPHDLKYNVLKISQSGMLLETDVPFDVESSCWMELSLLDGEQTVKFHGRVVTSEDIVSDGPYNYQTGMEIVEISKEDKSRLKKIIKSIKDYD
jgi:hypothetical protein